ncbi:DUF2971 domain-containing protein [Rhizobium sp. BK377]|uniref:DUF2971 domain-containing protein n=1 Tax=Rhizobium sp. BK377 TaxID=2587058 RepID=UPI001611645F|nr:DUF2971 domain-containing protein [Rhizobium sp. BK377]MBB3461082.1 hypothetical protein [Rhizobium sp. BK377]
MEYSNDLFSGMPLRLKEGEAEILSQNASTLSHYCDLSALQSILTKNELWASNIKFLNDEQEMEYGLGVARAIIREYLKSAKPKAKPSLITLKQLRADIPDVYVCCFCVEPDLLSQWRGYGLARQSVSIQFDRGRLNDFSKTYAADLVNVIYGQEDARRLFQSLATSPRLETHFRELLGRMEGLDLPDMNKNLILKAAARIKDKAFSEENEWRIVSHGRHPEFRVRDNLLVPYIKIGKANRALPILSVTVGPGKDVDLTVESIKKFLAYSKYYRDVHVKVSEIPFRG